MDLIIGLAGYALARLRHFYAAGDFAVNLAAVVGFVVLSIAGERLARRDTSRYLGRGARTDAVYTVFYLGGFYGILVGAPLGRLFRGLVTSYLPFLDLDLLAGLPSGAHVVLAIFAIDAVRYWLHRWTHASRTLWAFHKIHHSQEALTALTNYRFHFVDHALHSFTALTVTLVLGTPPGAWLLLGLALTGLNLLAHSGYRWGFGALDVLLVSPRYHGVHHSVEPEHANRNFGLTFSLWDHLFGTAAGDVRAPRAFGIPEPKLPESFFRQIAAPFLSLARR